MHLDPTGWLVTAIAILLTGISKSGLGGALGGLAVPFMAMWMSPRDAVAVMLPVLIAMDFAGIRAWRGHESRQDLRLLVPAALAGIAFGTLLFGVLPDAVVKGGVGLIAVGFTADRLLRRTRSAPPPADAPPRRPLAWACGFGSGITSTFAHAGGPPVMVYLLTRAHPRQTFVATSVFYFTVINVAKLPFYAALGLFRRDTLVMSALLLPLVPLGIWTGRRLLARIPEPAFRRFATAALGLSGLRLLWEAMTGA